MIINCICGLKKFKVDDNEIPAEGRKLKCGACSQVWFYDPNNPDASVPLDNEEINQTQSPTPSMPSGEVPQNVEDTISQAEQMEQQDDVTNAPFVEESSDDIILDESPDKPKMTIFSDDDLPSKSDMDENLDKLKLDRKKKKGFLSSLFSKKDPLEKARETEAKEKSVNKKTSQKKKEGGVRARLLVYFLIILLFVFSVMLVPYKQHVLMAFPQLAFYFEIVTPYYETLQSLLFK